LTQPQLSIPNPANSPVPSRAAGIRLGSVRLPSDAVGICTS
jgi:hypothetical protein